MTDTTSSSAADESDARASDDRSASATFVSAADANAADISAADDLDRGEGDHEAGLARDNNVRDNNVRDNHGREIAVAGRTAGTDSDGYVGYVDSDADDDTDDDGDTDSSDGDDGAEETGKDEPNDEMAVAQTESDLFRQSEIAADYIEGLLDILDFDGDIDELVQNGRPMVEVVGVRLNNLIGARGATLEALQELSRLAVYRQTGEPSRLLLDVGGFRAARRKELVAVAKNAAEKVKQYGESVRLEPMSAFERKCVHDVINATSGVESESEGVDPSRRVVIRRVDA